MPKERIYRDPVPEFVLEDAFKNFVARFFERLETLLHGFQDFVRINLAHVHADQFLPRVAEQLFGLAIREDDPPIRVHGVHDVGKILDDDLENIVGADFLIVDAHDAHVFSPRARGRSSAGRFRPGPDLTASV